MASSLLKSGVAKAKKAKDHVEEGLEKVRAKPWATPLGKALQVREAILSHCTLAFTAREPKGPWHKCFSIT